MKNHKESEKIKKTLIKSLAIMMTLVLVMLTAACGSSSGDVPAGTDDQEQASVVKLAFYPQGHVLNVIPEDQAVCRSQLKHSLFISYDCEARNAVMRISARIQGRIVPLPVFENGRKHRLRNLFSRSLKEVYPLDDH